MPEVFAKTVKGQDEIKTRAGGLSQRARQVLIFVDGKRDLAALGKMLPVEALESTLQLLCEQGYVAVAEASLPSVGQVVPVAPADVTLASINSLFRALTSISDKAELELARNFMMNTLKSFIGPYAALSVLEKVDAAQSHTEMRAQFDAWLEAIVSTRDGARRADELQSALLKII